MFKLNCKMCIVHHTGHVKYDVRSRSVDIYHVSYYCGDMNTVQRDKAYIFDDIMPLAMSRELWKALCNKI